MTCRILASKAGVGSCFRPIYAQLSSFVMESVDAIVFGGGISGLSAARKLVDNGVKVLVLEAQDRVGGRTLTVQDPDHGFIDLGGAYVGQSQKRVLKLVEEFGLELYKINEKEKTVINFRNSWSKFSGIIPPFWNPIKLLDLNHVMRTIDNMAKQIPAEAPWNAPKAEEWDAMTMKEFIDKTCWTSTIKELIRIVVESVFTVEPWEVSLLYVLWSFGSGGGIEQVVSVEGGAQEMKIKGGTQQLSEKLAEKLGNAVKLSTPVVFIEQKDDIVIVTDLHGNKYKGKFVISAIPQTLLSKITFRPELPPMRQQLIQRIPMGSIIKTNMFYSTAFWRDEDMCGTAISDHGPVATCIEDTKPDGSHPSLMGFVLADKAREMVSMTTEERKQAICEHYARVFRSEKFLNPIGYREKNWMEEEYSGGCYTIYTPPGVLTKYGRHLFQPVGRVLFAGTETSTVWSGYIEGGIQAGERAAREVLYEMNLIKKGDVWHEESCMDIQSYGPWTIESLLPSVTNIFQIIGGISLSFILYYCYPHLLNVIQNWSI